MKENIYNKNNETIGMIELPEKVFAAKWNPTLVKQVLLAHLANQRRPWAHAKDRSEVRGGGKKPWRQKGTGRARHGSIRSPIWVGGGKAHGPTRERDYSQKVNKKMKRAALFSVLSKKHAEREVKILDSLALGEPKTKQLFAILSGLRTLQKGSKKFDLLIVPDQENKHLPRAAANLVKTKVVRPDSLNVYDLLNHKRVFIEQAAVPLIATHYAGKQTKKSHSTNLK